MRRIRKHELEYASKVAQGYLGVLENPPNGFQRMRCLCHRIEGCEVWAKGSLFSPAFAYCHVRREVSK